MTSPIDLDAMFDHTNPAARRGIYLRILSAYRLIQREFPAGFGGFPPRAKTIAIRNAGRGHLSGTIRLAHHDRGFTIDNTVIEGEDTSVRISAHSLGMPEATRQDTQLHIVTNGGNHTIALSYRVPHQKNRGEPLQ